ncbi:MAG: ABC transporter substrate-binding protein [Eubacteriales bacterium]|nr:ABC transporter substrate-binding protein [Eubacteriales bacterium]
MKNRILAAIMAMVMVMGLAACGSSSTTATTAAATTAAATEAATTAAEAQATEAPATEAAAEETYLVGICQLVQHVALDAATQGFKDGLTAALGDRVQFDEQNASGEANNCQTIVNGFISENVDLIMANATPALTAAASATADIPILGTSVTAYGVALDIDDFNGTVGRNISGTSDLASLEEQAQMLMEIYPEAKKVGLLFCNAEPNSRYQVDEVNKVLTAAGIECVEYAFTDSNDITSVTTKACDEVDVIYIPTDNAAAANTEAIANVVRPAKVPVVAGEEGICKGCGTVTLSISYYDLGVTTGQMAAKILTGEADIATMPVEYTTSTKKYNAEICAELGVTVPADYAVIE